MIEYRLYWLVFKSITKDEKCFECPIMIHLIYSHNRALTQVPRLHLGLSSARLWIQMISGPRQESIWISFHCLRKWPARFDGTQVALIQHLISLTPTTVQQKLFQLLHEHKTQMCFGSSESNLCSAFANAIVCVISCYSTMPLWYGQFSPKSSQ